MRSGGGQSGNESLSRLDRDLSAPQSRCEASRSGMEGIEAPSWSQLTFVRLRGEESARERFGREHHLKSIITADESDRFTRFCLPLRHRLRAMPMAFAPIVIA